MWRPTWNLSGILFAQPISSLTTRNISRAEIFDKDSLNVLALIFIIIL